MQNETKSRGDIPSHTVREQIDVVLKSTYRRYTLTYSEGTLSIYAAFSRSKYLVVQFAQKPFVILVTYLIC